MGWGELEGLEQMWGKREAAFLYLLLWNQSSINTVVLNKHHVLMPDYMLWAGLGDGPSMLQGTSVEASHGSCCPGLSWACGGASSSYMSVGLLHRLEAGFQEWGSKSHLSHDKLGLTLAGQSFLPSWSHSIQVTCWPLMSQISSPLFLMKIVWISGVVVQSLSCVLSFVTL